jgi:hypothetical protein
MLGDYISMPQRVLTGENKLNISKPPTQLKNSDTILLARGLHFYTAKNIDGEKLVVYL